jgi:propionyl-CoA carboxylase alpha chain
MFEKILIANRGEIACRVIKTARRMGIRTVAVYSEADRDALHVEMADEASRSGRRPPPNPTSSSTDRGGLPPDGGAGRASGLRLSVRARSLSAGAGGGRHHLHRPELGRDRRDGRQDRIQEGAAAAKVSTVPGFLGIIESPEHAVTIADEIGYPVMIKASAGGGGKGMRIAHSAGEVAEGFARAKSEAASSFGDDRVFVEKFITDPGTSRSR